MTKEYEGKFFSLTLLSLLLDIAAWFLQPYSSPFSTLLPKTQGMGPVPYLCSTPGKVSIIMSSLVVQKSINVCNECLIVNQIIHPPS